MGPVVVERNACDLPAICSGAFHDSILLCLVGVTKGVMTGAFEFSGKIAFYTCDGDGFQRVDITKHLDGGSIGFVSDLEGNLSGSGLFNGKTDIVEMIGVSVRFCTLAESLRGTFEAAGTEVIQITDPPLTTLTLDLRMFCLAGILLIEISSYPRSFPDVGI